MIMKDIPVLKDRRELALLREAGRIAARARDAAAAVVRPGVTTLEVDRVAERVIREAGAVPTFIGYPPGAGAHAFRHTICASVNEEIVHGIPSDKRVLREGDLFTIDIGATWQGYVGDTAVTVGVGKIDPAAKRLMDTTRECLEAAIKVMRAGARLSAIGAAVEDLALSRGYSVVKNYCGHGVGRELHEAPQVPNYRDPKFRLHDLELKPGLVLAVEPMVCAGKDDNRILPDKWTVVTKDGSLAAHFEHTIAVTEGDPEVLTRP